MVRQVCGVHHLLAERRSRVVVKNKSMETVLEQAPAQDACDKQEHANAERKRFAGSQGKQAEHNRGVKIKRR
jgi:hypothetical protein